MEIKGYQNRVKYRLSPTGKAIEPMLRLNKARHGPNELNM